MNKFCRNAYCKFTVEEVDVTISRCNLLNVSEFGENEELLQQFSIKAKILLKSLRRFSLQNFGLTCSGLRLYSTDHLINNFWFSLVFISFVFLNSCKLLYYTEIFLALTTRPCFFICRLICS